MNKCGRCGRKLKGAKSVERGFGPVCFKKQVLERAFGAGEPSPDIETQCPGQMDISMIPGIMPEAPQVPEDNNTVHKITG